MTRTDVFPPVMQPAARPVETRPPLLGIGRNGFAWASDLKRPAFVSTLRDMEAFQMEFMAATRELWRPGFHFTGDCLYCWSRRWEYPYCWLSLLDAPKGSVLDVGSGITFFPFFLERADYQVACADPDSRLAPAFDRARAALRSSVEFRLCGIERLAWSDDTFDAVVCVSVIEHVSRPRRAIDELARVLRPGGRLIITWDISLGRDGEVLLEDAAVLVAALNERFEPLHNLDLTRPGDLLTTDALLPTEAWRLPWRRPRGRLRRWLTWWRDRNVFRSVTVMGSAWVRTS